MDGLIINLLDASISFEGNVLLEKINFSLAEAEFSYMIGRTGTGKSSLLKLLYGAYQLSDGHGTLFDYNLNSISKLDVYSLRRKVGIVFQDFSLFETWSVEDNLDFVLRATDWKDNALRKKRIKEVLLEVDLFNYLKESVHRLSGGEQQRLAIARAIINRPSLILADEPTGSLDPASADDILYLLHKISKSSKMAVLFATHDYRIIDKFPARIYECKNKTIIEK